MTSTFAVMLAELERALDEAHDLRNDRQLAHRLGDEALVSFLRALTMAIPPAAQRGRLAAALDRYERLPR
jgi:hypothetical protein